MQQTSLKTSFYRVLLVFFWVATLCSAFLVYVILRPLALGEESTIFITENIFPLFLLFASIGWMVLTGGLYLLLKNMEKKVKDLLNQAEKAKQEVYEISFEEVKE